MARKRGGLAGIWDRNKKVIKPLASGLAGLIGTPALGAAVGAAMGGLDREGKSGIGFDAKRGLKGGIAGYSAGSIGNSLGNALAKRGLDLGMNNALARANKGGGRLANAFLGKNPIAPPPVPSAAPPVPTAPAAPMPPAAEASPIGLGEFKAFDKPMVPAGVFDATASGPTTVLDAVKDKDGSVWNAIKPTAGKDGGNLGMWEKGLSVAGDVLSGKSGAETNAMEATTDLTKAKTRELDFENDWRVRNEEAMKRLRQMLQDQLLNNAGSPPIR